MMRSDLRTPLIATFVLSMLAQNFRLTLPLMASGGIRPRGHRLRAADVGARGRRAGRRAGVRISPSQRIAGMATLLLGALLLTAAVAPAYLVLATVVVGIGFGSTAFNATSQTLLLLRSDRDKRGR